MIKPLIIGHFILAITVTTNIGWAEVYSWHDRDGGIHYSDRPAANASVVPIKPNHGYRFVKYVYDGDTVLLDDGKKVRLLGINTPEVQTSRKDGEPGGHAAKKWLADRIEGRKVRLEYDSVRKDRYRRYLAHLFTPEGQHLNLELVAKGLATVNIHPPNLKYVKPLLLAQNTAEEQRLGIWGKPVYALARVDEITQGNRRGWRRLLGKPVAIQRGRKYDRLIFSAAFDARIAKDNLVLFPDLNTYLNTNLELRGWVSRRGSKYSMLIRHPSSLIVSNPE